jgi:hypothetical protein
MKLTDAELEALRVLTVDKSCSLLAREGAAMAIELLDRRKRDAAVDKAEAALDRTLNWLASYQGEAALGPEGPYTQAREALAALRQSEK